MRLADCLKKVHLFGIYKKMCMFIINHIFTGRNKYQNIIKRALLNSIGHSIGEGTTIISPIFIAGNCSIGRNCWINKGFTVHGNGMVIIGDNCDIAPEVAFLTGGHKIGKGTRRAGTGESYTIRVEDGCWIGARSTILRDVTIKKGCTVAACACVSEDVQENTLVGGVPARIIKKI